SAVDVERPGRGVTLKALAEYNLKNVAGLYVLAAFFHGRFVSLGGEVRGHTGQRCAGFSWRVDVGQLYVSHALLQSLYELIDPSAGSAVASLQILCIDMGMRDRGHGLVDVVENDHAVVKSERQVG